MFLKRKWKKIYLLPCIQPHKLDSVNKCKTNEKKKLCKEKSDSSVRLKNRDDVNLKTLFYGTSLNIILGFWLITLTVQLYFFIATLKIWVSYNLEWLHTLCILIHLLMQPSGVWWVTKTDFISPENINTIPSRSIFKTEVTVFYHTDRDLAGK